jgi:hypothetical protein
MATIVKLNIGGKKFVTSMSTLTIRGDNFLSRLVENDTSGQLPSMKDEKGAE